METRAAPKQYHRYRIEDFDLSQLLAMLERIDFPHDPARVKETFESLPRNVNTRGEKRSDITLDLLSDEVRAELILAAERYGYTL
ncbi:hypothetical protein [Microbulbifer pacificus]|uniref:Uncharacterized protein n=1 Tax=Microbulbifer pacificus TaxID=407164 RepID=A0AAU0MYI4_9GAMM|nr:hypothetical protein [Microbulbifer pacificus]WOX04488.1 hypothetical protein R5R33_12140 [Microbulbifer pacificus]